MASIMYLNTKGKFIRFQCHYYKLCVCTKVFLFLYFDLAGLNFSILKPSIHWDKSVLDTWIKSTEYSMSLFWSSPKNLFIFLNILKIYLWASYFLSLYTGIVPVPVQNYSSICFWKINENIIISGKSSVFMVQTHKFQIMSFLLISSIILWK